MKTIQAGWKGILLCLAIAVPAWFLVEFVPALEVVGAPVIAILAGMLLTLALPAMETLLRQMMELSP